MMNSNNRFVKYISAFIAVLLILSTTVISAFSAFLLSDDFLPEYKEYIGTAGRPVEVLGDGSIVMTDDAGERHTVSFGMTGAAEISFANGMYPVVSQTFTDENVTYVLIRFAGEVPVSRYGDKVQAVFTKLKVENGGEDSISSPVLPDNTVLMGENTAETVPAGETLYFEYCTTVTPLAEKVSGTFDSGLAEMTSYWDEKVKGDDSVTISVSDNESYMRYIKNRIYDLIGAGNEHCDICLAEAMNILSGGKLTEKKKVMSAAKSAADSLTPLSGDYCLRLSDGIPELSDNLSVLITLKCCVFICKMSGDTAGEKEYSEKYARLLHSAEKAMQNTLKNLPCDWEAATVKGSTDNMVLGITSGESDAALRRWYVCTQPFGTEKSYLADLAKESFDYAEKIGAPDSFVTALSFSDDTGTVTVGAGCPSSCLAAENEISVKNIKTAGGAEVGFEVISDGKEIVFAAQSTKNVPMIIKFPVFAGNIEYASCPFDTAEGTVTVPAGCDSVTVRLMTPVGEICERHKAKAALEKAIFAAWSADREDCTALSVKNLEHEYEKALELREGTAEEMTGAAGELMTAISRVSKTVAEYSTELSGKIPAGKAVTDKICQRFKVKEAGVISNVTVAGEFREGVCLKVYSLRENGYALFSPMGETEGKMCDAGFLFTLNIPVEAETEYVLYLSCEGDTEYDICAGAYDKTGLYKFESTDIIIYSDAALNADINVIGADRAELDGLYAKYTEASVKGYTKESVQNLEKAESNAAEVLCTPYVTSEKCRSVLENMKKAYNSLDTYASDEKKVESPVAAIVMTAGAVILLGVTAVSMIIANKKKNKEDETGG